MEPNGMLPIVALLALAVVVVVVLLRFMKSRHAGAGHQASAQADAPAATAPLGKEEEEYLDSSHILPGGRDALDTRAEAWRDNQRK